MSPYYWNATNSNANVFFVNSSGNLTNGNVNNTTRGVRPISFYNSYTKLWQSIVELGYKINPKVLSLNK